MATIELTKENFSDVVSAATLAVVDFWATVPAVPRVRTRFRGGIAVSSRRGVRHGKR
jgi:hypothetical protein